MNVIVIGGGAAGMTASVLLARKHCNVILLERGERLGRKLSASGNGQGNVTNIDMGPEHYFSDDREKVARALARFSNAHTVRFLEELGGIFLPDPRGRVYPAGRQASAVTDLLRAELARLGVDVRLNAQVTRLSFDGNFRAVCGGQTFSAEKVILAAGGKAAPNFGTDGSAYALAEGFGHTVLPCSPVLVQLRCDPARVRGLKGVRIDALLRVVRRGTEIYAGRGDVLFTESGVSGDAVFRASSYAEKGDELLLDFLPDVEEVRLKQALKRNTGAEKLLCVVNNALGRALWKQSGGEEAALLRLLKSFPLTVTGTLGFAYAQATRGGIPLAETDENLQSVKRRGLFFAGEILNVDGECGGYNLQWAFTSAHLAAEGALS